MDQRSATNPFDEQVRRQLEIVSTLLGATTRNQKAAQDAIDALTRLQRLITSEMSAMTEDVARQINNSATLTATTAAQLLQEKFVQADKHAQKAAARYCKASRWLGVKIFVFLTGILAVVGIIGWLILQPMLPSAQDIQMRRDEVAALESQAARLSKQGASLEWSTCGEKGRPCVRIETQRYGPEDEQYGIPHSGR